MYICIYMDKRRLFERINYWIVNIVFWCCMFVLVFLLVQTLFLSSFKIPSGSMEPTLEAGDYILVNKTVPGARLFNIFASLRDEETTIRRAPGVRPLRRNDVVVFNYPYAHGNETIRMDIMVYYVKRCIGLPGDTLTIDQGYYRIPGIRQDLGYMNGQKQARQAHTFFAAQAKAETLFPYDSLFHWNTQAFGPLYIPAKGDSLPLTREHVALYRKLITWECHQPVRLDDDGTAYIGDEPATGYRFTHNYYFMAGDNVQASLDSRYWGLVPEDYIVGKAWLIWKSIDPNTDDWRSNRFLKRIR